jgi:hypothetical protein
MSLSKRAGLLGVCLLLYICTGCASSGNQETHPGGTMSPASVGSVTRTTIIAHGMRNEILASKQKNGSMFL